MASAFHFFSSLPFFLLPLGMDRFFSTFLPCLKNFKNVYVQQCTIAIEILFYAVDCTQVTYNGTPPYEINKWICTVCT